MRLQIGWCQKVRSIGFGNIFKELPQIVWQDVMVLIRIRNRRFPERFQLPRIHCYVSRRHLGGRLSRHLSARHGVRF